MPVLPVGNFTGMILALPCPSSSANTGSHALEHKYSIVPYAMGNVAYGHGCRTYIIVLDMTGKTNLSDENARMVPWPQDYSAVSYHFIP
ncbi:unnamed protein product [Tuber melanosporum]|uniref:(Perigord truffle) hypothetical protein n=1 Tax=Tuber melanosporum (strain Mel28) TaxID=656061 RepID=D5GFZ5_TUBMM|nr:uncharacterized protein GSTUM_00001958001 [Tuber melanosporum]CAZ83438.1 unnamed protein product [Tuber melanosporum]